MYIFVYVPMFSYAFLAKARPVPSIVPLSFLAPPLLLKLPHLFLYLDLYLYFRTST